MARPFGDLGQRQLRLIPEEAAQNLKAAFQRSDSLFGLSGLFGAHLLSVLSEGGGGPGFSVHIPKRAATTGCGGRCLDNPVTVTLKTNSTSGAQGVQRPA